ncbi:MAG: ATP-dependent Clp protease proteolytic subunit [Megasphaera sp.]|nr:ATP-dependent Clp protease proteolytic subunit [Megasphaera sp.]
MNKYWRLFWGALLVLLCFCMPVRMAWAADTVHVISISGEIDGSQAALVQRGIEEAEKSEDRAIVISINTLGGRVDSALKIRDMLQHTNIPTMAYVESRAWSAGALIALSCRHIVMAPGSSIGAAEPIPNTEKNIAALKSEFMATAEKNGHNPAIAAAMVDKTDGYPGYAEAGKILSLSDSQARALNMADGTADTISEALALYSLGDSQTIYEDRNWRDAMIGVLQNEYVRTLFITLILVAVLVEIKMAGIGIGIITAIILGGILVLSGDESVADSLKVIGAFISSFLFIALELASPGVGIFGLVGVLLLFGSLFFMLGANVDAVYMLAGGTVLAIIVFYFIGKKLPKSRLLDKISLKNRSTVDKGYSSQSDKSGYLYQRGRTITILRPAGTIRIGKERVDAVSNGAFIDRDVDVRVIKVEGTRVVVEPVPQRK